MKRFTETEKWQDPWFRKLPGVHKLVFIFLIENCNNAGFYEFEEDHVAYMTGLKAEHVKGALKGLERAIKGASGWVWVKNFLRHQKNDDINPANPSHRQIIGLLKSQMDRFGEVSEFREFLAPYKGLFSPIGTGTGNGKEGMQGEKTKRQRKTPLVSEIPESLQTDKFQNEWDAWKRHRDEKRKKLTPTCISQQLTRLEAMGEDRAVTALRHSISNGWDGIFEPSDSSGNGSKPNPEGPRGEFAKPMNKPPEPPAHVLAARAVAAQ